MKFTKMHGTGNDFVVVANMNRQIVLQADQIAALCDRHMGIGADGVILVESSESCDVFMNYYNSDGSLAQMCGNGVRCLSKFVVDHHIVEGKTFDVETRAGRIGIEVLGAEGDGPDRFRVDMGDVNFDAASLPMCYKREKEVIGEVTDFDGQRYVYGCASMGNPHMVILVDDLGQVPLGRMGAHYESHPMFPEKCNISFAQVLDREHIRMDTWERGAGRTLACGTGTCSSVAVLNRLGKVGSKVEATLSGGRLTIEVDGTRIHMTGPAVTVFEGDIAMEALQ